MTLPSASAPNLLKLQTCFCRSRHLLHMAIQLKIPQIWVHFLETLCWAGPFWPSCPQSVQCWQTAGSSTTQGCVWQNITEPYTIFTQWSWNSMCCDQKTQKTCSALKNIDKKQPNCPHRFKQCSGEPFVVLKHCLAGRPTHAYTCDTKHQGNISQNIENQQEWKRSYH